MRDVPPSAPNIIKKQSEMLIRHVMDVMQMMMMIKNL